MRACDDLELIVEGFCREMPEPDRYHLGVPGEQPPSAQHLVAVVLRPVRDVDRSRRDRHLFSALLAAFTRPLFGVLGSLHRLPWAICPLQVALNALEILSDRFEKNASVHMSVHMSRHMSIHMSAHMSICMSVHTSVHTYIHMPMNLLHARSLSQ